MLVVKVSRLRPDGQLEPLVASADQQLGRRVLEMIRESIGGNDVDGHHSEADTCATARRPRRRPRSRP